FYIHPATDQKPYFSRFMTLTSIPEVARIFGLRELPYIELGYVIGVVTLVQVLLASVILILLPLFRIRWYGKKRRWTFLYFFGIGTGFMFFEIVLIQKLLLFLGQPVYAAAAVLAALLLFSGIGSYISSFFPASRSVTSATGGVITGMVLLYTLLLMPMLDMGMAWPVWIKIVYVLGILAPPALGMGMMFPFGLRLLRGKNETHIPWACGIDSCMSVVATALATMIAIESGFVVVMAIGAAAYAITSLSALKLGPSI
ncbi:hypothetical protein QLX67_04730, partial [Balneolaceae bacterium ANBcel3]|nr:hypothetical protein [Balneolaceae bacterium ANBcel3]